MIKAIQLKFYPAIIYSKGIDFYNNDKSQYNWDLSSRHILNKLLKIPLEKITYMLYGDASPKNLGVNSHV